MELTSAMIENCDGSTIRIWSGEMLATYDFTSKPTAHIVSILDDDKSKHGSGIGTLTSKSVIQNSKRFSSNQTF